MADDAGFTLSAPRARLLIIRSDLPRSARELAEMLAGTGLYFDRGGPVRLVRDAQDGGMVARPLSRESVVHAAHGVAQPYEVRTTRRGSEDVDITLPDRVAALYLDMNGRWGLLPLHGIAYAPVVSAGGGMLVQDGYDRRTGQWCIGMPDLARLVPEKPTQRQAAAALLKLRRTFATFPFADSPRCRNAAGLETVDVSKPPGMDESSLLAGLLTAIARPSLDLAPGLMVHAPSISGSGTGKGLLVRTICTTAYGRTPPAFTGGADQKELEKRLGAAMIEAAPAVFLDNLNGVALQSDMLASALTECPASMRALGRSEMVRLNAASFVVITGNGLSLSEDLVRRFMMVELDTRTEDPEARAFTGDLLAEVKARRAELLAAALTIWRWGQMNPRRVVRGAPLGGYSAWADWVRDPLLTLGCADPVARIAQAKATDQHRQHTAQLFHTWHERHGERPVRSSDLHEDVRAIIDPQGRNRQFVASEVARLVDTRIAGLTLTRCKTNAKWSVATYAVVPVLPLA